MSGHTKEPWAAKRVIGSGLIQAFDFRAGAVPVFNKGDCAIDGAVVYCAPEDAKRIVACVNACAGIPTGDLERRGVSLIEKIREDECNSIVQQRDELLAALIECRSSVKFDQLTYEKKARAYAFIGPEGKEMHTIAEAEANRLHKLIDTIDYLFAKVGASDTVKAQD